MAITLDSGVITLDSGYVTLDGGISIMAFADASLMELILGIEGTFDTAPVNFTKMRYTSESLSQNIQTTISNEIRSDRNVPALVRTSSQPGGDVNFELSYSTFEDLLEGLLASDWSADLALSGTIDADDDGSGNLEFTSDSTGAGVDFSSVQVGQWIKVGGFTSSSINGYHRVTAVDTGTATAHTVTTASAAATETGGGDETVSGSYIRNGVTKKSFSLEKNFTDLTNVFHLFTGMRVGQGSLNIQPGSIVTGSLSFQGATFAQGSSTAASGTLSDATTTKVLNAVDNVVAIIEDDAASTLDITQLSVQVNNNLRSQSAVGSLGPVGIGYGRCEITGTMQVYMENGALVDRLNNGTSFLLSWRFVDDAGNALIITMPNVEFTQLNTVAGGNNQDILADGQYQALLDATTGCAIQFDKFAA